MKSALSIDGIPHLSDYSELHCIRSTTRIGERVADNQSVPNVDGNRRYNDSENISPIANISIPAEAINTRTGHLNFNHSALVYILIIYSTPSLVFDSINGLHCYVEEILPAGSFVPSFRIRAKNVHSLIGLDFKITCVLSSLDLLLWATRENDKDTSMIKVLSQLDEWCCLDLDTIYLENTTKVFIEIIKTNEGLNPISEFENSEFEIEKVTFVPQNSSPVKVLQKRISQNTSPESSFTCSFDGCHRSFSRIQNLKSHEKIHVPNRHRFYVCHVCEAGFTRSQDLTRHLNIHTGTKNFKCPGPGCRKSFSRKDALRRHIRSVKCCDLSSL